MACQVTTTNCGHKVDTYFSEEEPTRFFAAVHSTRHEPIALKHISAGSLAELRLEGLELLMSSAPSALRASLTSVLAEQAINTGNGVVRDEPGNELLYLRALASRFAPNVSFSARRIHESDWSRF